MGKLLDTRHHEPRDYSIFGEPPRRLPPASISASATALMTLRGTARGGVVRHV